MFHQISRFNTHKYKHIEPFNIAIYCLFEHVTHTIAVNSTLWCPDNALVEQVHVLKWSNRSVCDKLSLSAGYKLVD